MSPSVWYFAHPVAPPCACRVFATHEGLETESGALHWQTSAEQVICNADRAKRWLAWIWERTPEIVVIGPWITHVELGDDADPAQRERGLRDSCAVAALCGGIILAGGRISAGMFRELEAVTGFSRVIDRDAFANDLTPMGPEPPVAGRPQSDADIALVARLRAIR